MNQWDSIPLTSCPALSPQVRFRLDPVSADPLLLYPEGVLVLNVTAADLIQRCDGKTDVLHLLSQMSAEYEVDAETLRGDVLDCLKDLSRRALLVFLT